MTRTALLANAAAILAIVLARRALDGTAFHLVQSWYEPVLYLTAALLSALAVAAAVPLIRSNDRASLRLSAAGSAAVLVVGVPIVLLAVFEPAPLGSASIERTSSDDSFLANLGNGGSDPAGRNLFQWAIAFRTETPASIAGQAVDLTAFVYHPDDAVAGRFMAARFVVACCVADARGIALPVEWAGARELLSDTWVEVRGEVALSVSGEPYIRADSVVVVDAPSNPYLYP